MYNGVGIRTARGSGTNGYVQRNLAGVRRARTDIKKNCQTPRLGDTVKVRKPNHGLLLHDQMRMVEIELITLADQLREAGMGQSEIQDCLGREREQMMRAVEDGSLCYAPALEMKSTQQLAFQKEIEMEKFAQAFKIEQGSHASIVGSHGAASLPSPRLSPAAHHGAGEPTVLSFAPSWLRGALEASLAEVDAKAAAVNGPLSAAILRRRLVPDHFVLLEVDRTRGDLRSALLEGEALKEVRGALERSGHAVELPDCGAKVFVRPDQYAAVLTALADKKLQPRHIAVSAELEGVVTSIIDGAKHTSVKRRCVAETEPTISEEPSVRVRVKRTFIHLELPSSLCSAPSSSGGCAAASV